MNLSNSSTTNSRAVAPHDDNTTANEHCDTTTTSSTTVNSYDAQSSDVPSIAVTANNGYIGSVSATSNSR
jgi:hypothetical protein